jgi:hypothetical protein
MTHYFTGYDPRKEERAALTAQCIKFDIMSLVCGDVPETRGIKDLMRRDDQFNMNSCAGFGVTGTGEVTHYLQTGVWRQFNPLWSYRRGQEVSNIRGDNGATINGVVQAAKTKGFLPEDIDNNGTAEYPYKVDYNFPFPRECWDIAANWKIGYSIELHGFDEILRFLQAGQGAVVVGGAWGNWRPGPDGIVRRFVGGGSGHARSIVDWVTINGEVFLVEPNSHYANWGKNGFSFQSKSFVDGQAKDKWTVTIGCSDLSSPEPRVVNWDKELKFIPDNIFSPNTGEIA